jgi:hypothetical protein
MNKVIYTISFLFIGVLSAETHGGVAVANAQYQAAVNSVFATEEVIANLDRVLKIERIVDSGTCSLFQVVTGAKSSQTGIVSPSQFSFLKVTSPVVDGMVSTEATQQIVETSNTLPSCI